ncbi:MAG: nitrogenase iron protein NifH [Tissierellia bacterium]|nr:nitrogenase iron protein NifH [Tissierellia bacterium]
MIKIAIYGKGGIGKSTTTSNLTAALIDRGYKVMQIGCDPKADSTKNLLEGKKIKTVLDTIKEKGERAQLDELVVEGFNGALCVEAGGPTPGIGCAGRGIITAFERLEKLKAYEVYQPDIVIYDVLGDVVCGGFAMPLRGGYADYVLIVSSGEMMALYAADNISTAIKNFSNRGYAKLAGIILNARNVENEDEIVNKAASEMNTSVIKKIPRDGTVQKAEVQGKTVIQAFPDSEMAAHYQDLAREVLEVVNHEL